MMQLENFVSGDSKNMTWFVNLRNPSIGSSNHLDMFFQVNLIHDCIYHKFYESKYICMILYVDIILLASNNIDLLYETEIFLAKNFEIKDLDTLRSFLRYFCIVTINIYIYIMFSKDITFKTINQNDSLIIKKDKFSLDQLYE
ncbi:hypothetical protein CR513_62079, partial [Mucuna pruriens]